MIVTTGKSIRIETGYQLSMHFERTSDAPGMVRVTLNQNSTGRGVNTVELPGNPEEAEQFIAAYRRCLDEDVGYRDRRNEFPERK